MVWFLVLVWNFQLTSCCQAYCMSSLFCFVFCFFFLAVFTKDSNNFAFNWSCSSSWIVMLTLNSRGRCCSRYLFGFTFVKGRVWGYVLFLFILFIYTVYMNGTYIIKYMFLYFIFKQQNGVRLKLLLYVHKRVCMCKSLITIMMIMIKKG